MSIKNGVLKIIKFDCKNVTIIFIDKENEENKEHFPIIIT